MTKVAHARRLALLSVYNKEGIIDFARSLTELGFDILASGGTAAVLAKEGLPVIDVGSLVGEPLLDHRVVTLSREIHAGLLAKDTPEDRAELARLNIRYIDLVCCDLYPLKTEIDKPGSTRESVVEQTDIGGPTMIRSGAKGGRIVVCDPADRTSVLEWLAAGEPNKQTFIQKLHAKAEFVIADYVLTSARYHGQGIYDGLVGKLALSAKYGENAWQTPAELFSTGSTDSLALPAFTLVAGSAPSYNNLAELDRHILTLTHIAAGFEHNFGTVPCIALGTKHGNPCGAAVHESPTEAIKAMVVGDTRAIFGGLVSVNFPIDEEEAELLLTYGQTSGRRLLDAVIAPAFTPEAIALLVRKGDKCRFLANSALSTLGLKSLDHQMRLRPVRGGFLRQPAYDYVIDLKDPALVTTGKLLPEEERDVVLAWAIGSTSNSNTISLVKNAQLIGNGVGQQDRVSCCELAIKRATDAGHDIKGSVAYSDSFFPFPDGPQTLIDAGVAAIWATNGSVRDNETVTLCQKHNVTLCQVPDTVARGFFGH